MKLGIYLSSIVTALLLLTAPAEAADWLNYVEGKAGSQVFVDMESIKSTSANTIMVVKKVEPAGTTAIASVVSKVEIDCGRSMIRYLETTTRFKGGRLKTASTKEEFRKVTVEDDDESLLELVCSLKKSR